MTQPGREDNLRGFWGIVAAQFLGAFNDNALRWFLIALAMAEVKALDLVEGARDAKVGEIITVASVLFLAPYILFSMHAGSLADRFSKRTVLMWSKAAEALIMLLCVTGFLLSDSFDFISRFLLIALFFLGVQATYYSPAKFGVLPEILPERRLSWGNGIFEMTGVAAIILGCVCGARFVGVFGEHLYVAPLIFAVAAILGFVGTWFVPRLPPAAPHQPVRLNPLHALRTHGRQLFRQRVLLLTLLSIVFIWSLGLLFQLNMPLYARDSLSLREDEIGYTMGVVAIGVGLGNVVAGYVSGKTIETGLVPLGCLGTALSSVALFFTAGAPGWSYAFIGILGFFAGIFIVPMHALLQEESPVEDKGGIWAATNFLQTTGMLAASGLFALLQRFLKLSPALIFLVCGIGTLGIFLGFMAMLPEILGRLIVWLRRLPARIRVVGQEHVPPHGPILFVMNGAPRKRGYHMLAGTRRFVRLLLPEDRIRGLLTICVARTLRAIPETAIGGIEQALDAAGRALAEGDSVCVFARSDRHGDMEHARALSPFLAASPAKVIPVRLTKDEDGRTLLSFGPAWEEREQPERLLADLAD